MDFLIKLSLVVFGITLLAFITSTPESRKETQQKVDAHMEQRQERIDFIDNVIRPD